MFFAKGALKKKRRGANKEEKVDRELKSIQPQKQVQILSSGVVFTAINLVMCRKDSEAFCYYY